MKRRLLGVALVCLCVLVFAGFQTTGQVVRARLSGFMENNPISTAARGTFTGQISPDNSIITYTLTYSNIEGGTAFASHIHFGQWWVNGGVAAFLCGGGGKPECPSPSGTVTGTIIPGDIIGPVDQGIDLGEFDEVLLAIRAGSTYVNVHSTAYPGGEIRGQLRPRLRFLYGIF